MFGGLINLGMAAIGAVSEAAMILFGITEIVHKKDNE